MRHVVLAARLVLVGLARIWRQLQRWSPDIRGAANERLCQIIGINNSERPLQVRFFQRHVFDDGRTKTSGYAVATSETLFDVCRRDLQGVALEPSGGEAIPGMLGILRRPLT